MIVCVNHRDWGGLYSDEEKAACDRTVARCLQPKAIQRMMSMLNAPNLDAYLADVRAAVGVGRQDGGGGSTIKAAY